MTVAVTAAPRSAPALRAHNALVIASGKGGVGKTWLAVTLAHVWARRGRRVVLIDGDLGLANIDIQLGVAPERDLLAVLSGRLALGAAVTRLERTGFDLVAGRSGSGSLASVPAERIVSLRRDIVALAPAYDTVVLDLAAGLDRPVRILVGTGARLAVVLTADPTSLTDAYALIKVTHIGGDAPEPVVVVNQAKSEAEGRRTYETLRTVCARYLGLEPALAGIVRHDPQVIEAIRAQAPLLERSPNGRAAEDVAALATRLAPPG
ncbi:MAG: P-loop NTPase [Alphaproteobacteria bacterium]